MDKMKLQNDEFDAADGFAKQLVRLFKTAVVDDDYPEVRHGYESALRNLIGALIANGRIPNVVAPQPVEAEGLPLSVQGVLDRWKGVVEGGGVMGYSPSEIEIIRLMADEMARAIPPPKQPVEAEGLSDSIGGVPVAVVGPGGYPNWLVSWLESATYRTLPQGTKLYTTPQTEQPAIDLEQLSESDKDVAIAQAVEFAEYVQKQAKGEMVKAAQRFLSLPYSQEMASRLAIIDGAKGEGDSHG